MRSIISFEIPLALTAAISARDSPESTRVSCRRLVSNVRVAAAAGSRAVHGYTVAVDGLRAIAVSALLASR
jgi:hypothetical protein|tara:strand:- start:3512 stop:3724 length:213 start_codon:yes stop_codon:yes gene_type:complete